MGASASAATTCGSWSRPFASAIAFIFFSLALFPQAQALTVHEKALAAKDEFYFLIDLPAKRLVLKYHGAHLADWPIQAVETIAARTLFFKRVPHKFPEVFYVQDALIDPPVEIPRPEIIPPDPNQPEETGSAAIPPTMEELIKAPQDYTFRGDSSWLVRIHMPAPPANGMPQPKMSESFRTRLSDFVKGITGDIPPVLILTLANEDGEKIYRAFPEKVNILVYFTPPVPESNEQ